MTADNKDKRYYMIQASKNEGYWCGYEFKKEQSQGTTYRDIESLLEQFSKLKKGDKVIRNVGEPDEKVIYTLP